MNQLANKIMNEFLNVPFPIHCGLHAAMAMDDWIGDERELRKITRTKDVLENWWEIPTDHLIKCMLALSYLDSAGIEFYLPAYMKAIIDEPKLFDEPGVRSNSWQVLFEMLPDTEDQELMKYFNERFSKISGSKKEVCVEFLELIAGSAEYDDHARKIAKEALNNEFW
ncbi:MAG: hypothetical protein P1U57_00275 [Oleibacter sp.]|nr:hypothetical protein [Thalassolituus sp.]